MTEIKNKQIKLVRDYGRARQYNTGCEVSGKELTEQQLEEMGYGRERESDHAFASSGSSALLQKKPKFILKNKTTGKVISVHSDAPSAVSARNRVGSFSTHAIIKEDEIHERINMPQGHKYTADPITDASSDDKGRKKPLMGTKANTAVVVSAILNKSKG